MYKYYSRSTIDPNVGERFFARPQVGTLNQNLYDMTIGNASFLRFDERLISDSVSPHSNYKACEHYKCSHIPGSGTKEVGVSVDHVDNAYLHIGKLTAPSALGITTYGTQGKYTSGLPLFTVDRADGGFIPPPVELDSLLQSSLNAMMPKIKAELSIVNTLIELKDIATFRSTIESVKNLVTRFDYSKWRNKKYLAEIFRTKADVYLQYKFNIKPLLSDISGIYRSLANTERRINDFITRSGRVRVSHFSRDFTESTDPEPVVVTTNIPYNAFDYPSMAGAYNVYCSTKHSRYVRTEPASFHVQVQYNYNYTAYQAEHARILALLDAVGFNLNPVIIWNAIPWSFVVDWVFGVGRYLDSLKVGAMDPKINILRCLWSIKRRRTIQILGSTNRRLHYTMSIDDVPASYASPIVVESTYRRQPFQYSGSSIISSGLNSTEFTLGAALVISRRRRPTRLRR